MIDLDKDIVYEDLKNNWFVRRSRESDIEPLAKNMSKENVEEIWVAHRLTPEIVIDMAVKQSVISLTIEAEGKLLGIFGIRNPSESKAEIFLLVTNDFVKYGRVFLRNSREFIDKLLNGYDQLEGMVYEKNTESIFWMKWCRAHMEEPMPYGVEGKLFSRFHFTKNTL